MPYKPKRYPWQPCKGEQSQMQVLTCIVRQNSFSGKTYLNMITYPVRQVILQYKAMGLLHMEWFLMQDRRSAAAIGVQKNCQSSHLCMFMWSCGTQSELLLDIFLVKFLIFRNTDLYIAYKLKLFLFVSCLDASRVSSFWRSVLCLVHHLVLIFWR